MFPTNTSASASASASVSASANRWGTADQQTGRRLSAIFASSHRFYFATNKNINIANVMDASPFFFLENTPIERVYAVFVKMNLAMVAIVNSDMEPVGLIRRKRIVEYMKMAEGLTGTTEEEDADSYSDSDEEDDSRDKDGDDDSQPARGPDQAACRLFQAKIIPEAGCK
jgi:predicted transcriptional regulator